MINSINHSYYFNYSKANKYNKSEDKFKDKEEDAEIRKENNTIIPKHRTIRDIKDISKNDNRIRVTQIDQKENQENKENKNLENIKRNDSQIKRQTKLKKEKYQRQYRQQNIKTNENIENKENQINKENEENKESKENKENKENEENKDNKDNKDYNYKENKKYKDYKDYKDNKESIKIKEIKEEKSKFEDDEIIKKYFDISKINNIQIPKEYINIIYYNLLKEEEKGINPMPDYTYMQRQNEINDKMRSILVDWLIDVHFKFGFTDETLFMTISIIDRYLSICQISRTNFQLLGITALMIACKHEEIDLPKIDDFIYITDNAYVKKEVIKMEEDVLYKLNFEFLYPSPIKFFEYLSLNFNFTKKHHMMGKYLMESFLLDVKNVKYKPSIISCACTYIVMKFFKMSNYHESYSKKFYILDEAVERYSEHNIKECAKDICLLVDNINKTNYQACLKKYSKPEQEKVSIIIMNN